MVIFVVSVSFLVAFAVVCVREIDRGLVNHHQRVDDF